MATWLHELAGQKNRFIGICQKRHYNIIEASQRIYSKHKHVSNNEQIKILCYADDATVLTANANYCPKPAK